LVPGVPDSNNDTSRNVVSVPPKVSIGAVTLEKVQAHLANKPLAPPPPPPPTTAEHKPTDAIPKSVLAGLKKLNC